MDKNHIIAVNKQGVTGRFSKVAWDRMKNKLGWRELGSTNQVKIPLEVQNIMDDKIPDKIPVINIKKDQKDIPDIKTIKKIESVEKLDKVKVIDYNAETERMKKELREAGWKFHHMLGYVKTKILYDDYKEQQDWKGGGKHHS